MFLKENAKRRINAYEHITRTHKARDKTGVKREEKAVAVKKRRTSTPCEKTREPKKRLTREEEDAELAEARRGQKENWLVKKEERKAAASAWGGSKKKAVAVKKEERQASASAVRR